MTAPAGDSEPTQDELLAMAYTDGELSGEELARFEARLASEPALLREVSELRRLDVIARRVAPREPGDFVSARLERSPLHGGLGRLAFLVLAVLSVVGATVAVWAIAAADDLGEVPKALILLGVAAIVLLFLLTLRRRLLLLPHDPYREVQR